MLNKSLISRRSKWNSSCSTCPAAAEFFPKTQIQDFQDSCWVEEDLYFEREQNKEKQFPSGRCRDAFLGQMQSFPLSVSNEF